MNPINKTVQTITDFLAFCSATVLPGVVIFAVLKSTIHSLTSIHVVLFSDIRIYPNPAKDVLLIDLGSANAAYLDILNIHGQRMLTLELNNSNKSVDISELPKGLYFVQFKIQNKTLCKKLMKD